jgi:hypothetical protein
LLLAAILAWCAYYAIWLGPRRKILAFRFDGAVLACYTTAGWQRKPVAEIASITEMWQGRGRRLGGWWLEFRGGSWVLLPISVDNAAELIVRLHEPAKSNPTTTPQTAPNRVARLSVDRGLPF